MTKQGRGDVEVDEPKQIERIKSDRTEVIEICDSTWRIANRADQDLVRNSRGISEEIWIMPITAASDVAANGLDRDDYITLLAKGTGLPSQQVEATKTAWDGLEMTAPIFVMPGESGDRNFRRSITSEVSRDGERSASAVAVICSQVAEGIMDQPPDPSLRYEILVAALGEVIFEAPYGVRPVDLHSYGDAAVFNVRSPLAVGSLLRRVLNRDQEGQTPIQPEHPAITKLKAKLCPQAARHGVGEQRAGGGASGSSAAALQQCEATYRASDNDREARKQSASTLLQAALGKAAFRVYVEAENDAQMKALAEMTQEAFAEGLLSADLIPGQALRPIVRTAFTLSLEDIPQGFGVVNLSSRTFL